MSGHLARLAALKGMEWHAYVSALQPVPKEIAQCFRRFPDSFEFCDEHSASMLPLPDQLNDGNERMSPLSFSVALMPTDPGFKFELPNGLRVKVTLPTGYPSSDSAHVQVMDESLPYEVRRCLEVASSKFCEQTKGSLILRSLFRWLDRNMEACIGIGMEQAQSRNQLARQNTSSSFSGDALPAEPTISNNVSAPATEQTIQVQDNPELKMKSSATDTPEIAGSDKWTPVQQLALEKALASTQGMPANERWEQIAAMVGNKTPKQCVKRFKELRKLLQQVQAPPPEATKAIPASLLNQDRLKPEGPVTISTRRGSKGEAEVSVSENKEQMKYEINPQHKGTQVKFEDVLFSGVSLIKPVLLRVQILCLRCGTSIDWGLGADPVTVHCEKCHLVLAARFRPSIAHINDQCIGYVDTDNCKMYDILPTDVLLTCTECGNDNGVKNVQRAQVYDLNCRSCHAKISFRYLNPRLTRLDHGDALLSKDQELSTLQKQVKKQNAKKGPKPLKGFTIGEPLPNNGACKHYKHSYRWMRFPCCGKAFPCDVCHDDASDHEMKWANRMICGNCSREMPFSDKECPCGQTFKPGARAHWEGGKGCRNSITMARHDSKKYKGMWKTQSRRSQQKDHKKKAKR